MGNGQYDGLRREELISLLEQRDAEEAGGIRLTYKGQTPPWRIVRQVQPRRQQIDHKLSVGSEDDQSCNLIMEGENLQGMVSLYKYRGQVDLILTDPPYNTGQDFRYNDRWDEDPNDPDLGRLVPVEDGSRHTKWLRFMAPRLWMMHEMLKPSGVLAICIDHRELFRLGFLLDQMFGEANRLGIINWQKTTAKNDKKHVASLTEYVLIYAKDVAVARTELLARSEKADNRFGNPDKDIDGDWKQGDPIAVGDDNPPSMVYAIQSPFTGQLHYPPARRHWSNEKRRMREWLESWGVSYEERAIPGDRYRGLVIRGAPLPSNADFAETHATLQQARETALERLRAGSWPRLYFGHTGETKPMLKIYANQVKAGSVPTSFWVDDSDQPFAIETVSWQAPESGRSREGIEELDRLVGRGHAFETVKPLQLFSKIVQIWCPPNGIVLDPFAGSGTTAHAVLQINKTAEGQRRFILIVDTPRRGCGCS
jgi:adenine-specific DNA-methyltransferase